MTFGAPIAHVDVTDQHLLPLARLSCVAATYMVR
jgi:hypothetical protein